MYFYLSRMFDAGLFLRLCKGSVYCSIDDENGKIPKAIHDYCCISLLGGPAWGKNEPMGPH